MRARSIVAAATLLIVFIVAGCPQPPTAGNGNSNGGGNANANGPSNRNTNFNAPPAEAAVRTASIEHVEEMIANIELDGDPARSEQIAAMLRSMPEFALVTIYDGCVLGTFTDGELLVIVNNSGLGTNPPEGESEENQLQSGITKPRGPAPSAAPAPTPAPSPSSALRARPRGSSDARSQVGDLLQAKLPAAKLAIFVNAMGNSFTDSIPLFNRWFRDAGYQIRNASGTVEGLRTQLAGAGVFYISTHGVAIPAFAHPQGQPSEFFMRDADIPRPTVPYPESDGKDHFALWTRTDITNETINQYRDEIRAGKLVYGLAATDWAGDSRRTRVLERHFMITEQFVRDHWRFSDGSLLYIDACSSANGILLNACLGTDVNASAFIGWTRPVFDSYSDPTVRYFFDRTLAANQYQPVQTPPQRPYTATEAVAAMATLVRDDLPLDSSRVPKSLFRPPSEERPEDPSIARLVLIYDGDAETILLRPAIQRVVVSEVNTGESLLTIHGAFPDEPGEVTVNGTSVDVRAGEWTPSRIVCEIPRGGSGGSGPVVVRSGGVESNLRRLTEWNLQLQITFMDFPTLQGINCPGCFYEATIDYNIRADVGTIRSGPEAAPTLAGYIGSPAFSNLTVTNAGGSYMQQQDVRYTVALTPNEDDGAASIGTCIGFLPPADNNYVGACYHFVAGTRDLRFSPTYLALGLVQNFTGGGALDGAYEYGVLYIGNVEQNTLSMTYSPNFNIEPGEHPFFNGPNSIFRWDGASAMFPPSPDDPN